MNKMIMDYIKDRKCDLSSSESDGIEISNNDNEIVIKGSKLDLIDLAEYILDVALSDKDIDHIHLDELSLIDDNSDIKNLIIEKQ